jgi:STE24 endopeptidase
MSEQPLDPERQAQAREYARRTRWLAIAGVGLLASFLLAVLLSGLSADLRTFLDVPLPARTALYFLSLAVGYGIISFPLTVYRSYVLPHRFGLSQQTPRSWLADEAKSAILGLALGTGMITVIYLLLETFPQTWWLLAFGAVTVLTLVMTNLAPVLILPLFFRQKPLEQSELRRRLLDLAERCRAGVNDVFQIDYSQKTSAANAMLLGWGNTRRIAISDTLIHRYAPDEIEAVMAHELGHHSHRDVPRLILVQSGLMLIAFYLTSLTLEWAVPVLGLEGISDVAGIPLLMLVMASIFLVLSPFANAYSRHLETSADRYALAATGKPKAFASMLTRLTDQNLDVSRPARWVEILFYDHPPHYRRLELARRFQREEQQ